MPLFIHPNKRQCPICSGWDIAIENDEIWCENCTASFIDPKWAESEEEDHEVTFNGFEDQNAAAERMRELAGGKP